MKKRKLTKTLIVRVAPELHAIIPDICHLHGNVPISEVLRRLLAREADRLNRKLSPSIGRERTRLKAAV